MDASNSDVGAVLSQRSDNDQKLHPCAFLSRRLSPAERNYDVGNRELLAVKTALEEWRHWLEGSEVLFLVWTDDKNLEYLRSAKRLNSRQASWALLFTRFNFTLSYHPGSKNTKPDTLSRVFGSSANHQDPKPILPAACLATSLVWGVEKEVRQVQLLQPDPGGGPPGRLFQSESESEKALFIPRRAI